MKKLVVLTVLLALLLSLGGITATAALPVEGGFTPGQYAGEDPEQFSTLGDMEVDWIPSLDGPIDVTDGHLSDWYASGAKGTVVTPHNMISWVDNGSGMPEGWKMTTFYAADTEYLYFAFDIVDADFTYASSVASYNGDAIQLCLDFGYKLGNVLEKNPDSLTSVKNIFYSFACVADGAPLGIVRQESDRDGVLSSTNGDRVKGAARKTDEGWSVELALSWDTLYEDYVWKAWEEDPRVYVGASQRVPLSVGMCFYYINRTDSETITWAAGAVTGYTDENGHPTLSWAPYDNAAKLNLDADYAMQVTCQGVVGVYEGVPMEEVLTKEDGSPRDDEFPDPEAELSTPLPGWTETPEGDTVEITTVDEELQAILDKYGCTSVVGVGSLTALAVMAAAAYIVRKKD